MASTEVRSTVVQLLAMKSFWVARPYSVVGRVNAGTVVKQQVYNVKLTRKIPRSNLYATTPYCTLLKYP